MEILETHIVPEISKKIRLQEYAVGIFKTIPTKSGIKKAIKTQDILLNGIVAETSNWIEKGQKIELLAPEIKPRKIFKLKFEVIFEDDFLAIINKPSGYPTSGNYFRTIENALPFNLKNSKQPDKLPFPQPAHRLDNPTSGMLIIAKTRNVLTKLNLAFEAKEIQKIYHALVVGKTSGTFKIEESIKGKNCLTEAETIKNFMRDKKEFSLLRLIPSTGRTHQIRIHLSSKNLPIVGDTRYGSTKMYKQKGICLAATGLKFSHPVTKQEMNFEIPVPKRFYSHLP